MGDLQTELKTKLIPKWTEGGPDNPEEPGPASSPTPMSNTERVYKSVSENEGKTADFHTKALLGAVPVSSTSSLLRQLEQRGFLRHEGQRPAVFFTTEKKYVIGQTTERRLAAIARATEQRKQASQKKAAKRARQLLKPVIEPAPQVYHKESLVMDKGQQAVKRTPEETVSAMDVRTARAIFEELKKLFAV